MGIVNERLGSDCPRALRVPDFDFGVLVRYEAESEITKNENKDESED